MNDVSKDKKKLPRYFKSVAVNIEDPNVSALRERNNNSISQYDSSVSKEIKKDRKSERRRDDYDFKSNDENLLLPKIKDINNSALAIKNTKSDLPILKAGHRKDSERLNEREAQKLKQLESRSDLKESMVNIKRKLVHGSKRDASQHGTCPSTLDYLENPSTLGGKSKYNHARGFSLN